MNYLKLLLKFAHMESQFDLFEGNTVGQSWIKSNSMYTVYSIKKMKQKQIHTSKERETDTWTIWTILHDAANRIPSYVAGSHENHTTILCFR